MMEETACTEMEEKIPLMVYDELPAEEAATVQLHMAQCPTCKATYDELRESASFLDESTTSLPPLMLSDEERCHILTSILEGAADPEEKPTTPAPPEKESTMMPVIWVILVVAILGLAILLYRHFVG